MTYRAKARWSVVAAMLAVAWIVVCLGPVTWAPEIQNEREPNLWTLVDYLVAAVPTFSLLGLAYWMNRE